MEYAYSSVWGSGPDEIFVVGQSGRRAGLSTDGPPQSLLLRLTEHSVHLELAHDCYNLTVVEGLGSGRIFLGGTLGSGSGQNFPAFDDVAVLEWDRVKPIAEDVVGNREVGKVIAFAWDRLHDLAYAFSVEGEIFWAPW